VSGYANFGSGGALITSAGGITGVSMNLTGSSGTALTLSGTGGMASTGAITTTSNIATTSTSTATPGLAVNGYANFGTGSALITSAGGITAVSLNLTGTSGNALTLSGTGGMAITGASAGLSIATGTLQSRGINDNLNGSNQGSSGYILQSQGTNLGYKWVIPPSSISCIAVTAFPTLTTTPQTVIWSPSTTVSLSYGSIQVSGILMFQNSVGITSSNNLFTVNVYGGSAGATSISQTQQLSLPINATVGQFFAIPFMGYTTTTGTNAITVKITGNSGTSVGSIIGTSQMTISYNS
jgi:autotransporter family porin